MQQFEDLRFRGFSYDIRVLNAPLEVMVHRAALADAPRPTASGMLGDLLLEGVERLLALRAGGVHVAAWRRLVSEDWACTCGVVILPGLSAATCDGHLDFARLEPAPRIVAARRASDELEGIEAVCRPCAWTRPAAALDEAERALAGHDCGQS